MVNIYYIDLFCGAGGTSTGIHLAGGNILACVNHDANAIKSHKKNHPQATHFTEDIRNMSVIQEIAEIVKKKRQEDPIARFILWASLECTNFSKAKGGKPKNPDSRSLAEYMPMYIKAINPDYFFVENVREFQDWGPLDQENQPIKSEKGKFFNKWVEEIKTFGYEFEKILLNSADFGAYTSRERLFIQFARKGMNISWPDPTHAKLKTILKNPKIQLKQWNRVKEVLDLEKEGASIFDRKKVFKNFNAAFRYIKNGKKAKYIVAKSSENFKIYKKGEDDKFLSDYKDGLLNDCIFFRYDDLVEATEKRILAGLIKFVAKGDSSFIQKYFSGRPEGKVISTEEPCGAIKTKDGHGIVNVDFILKYNSMSKNLTYIAPSVEDPAPVISTQGRVGKVAVNFLHSYYGNGKTHSTEEPCPTISTVDRFGKVDVKFIDQEYGNGRPVSIEEPCSTITANHKFSIVNAFILNPQYGSKGSSIEEPCPVVIARQDKRPLSLVQFSREEHPFVLFIYEGDSETMVKIKQIMAEYGISDIKTRMLFDYELLKIQGFPQDYKLIGNMAERKKYIGNSVEVNTAKSIIKNNIKDIFSFYGI